MSISPAYRLLENIEAMACRNSAERVVEAVAQGRWDAAKDLARKHKIAWHLADLEFRDENQPHTNNDFCDDE
ncbi:MAG: hypothetical protein EBZ83_06710 [Verrucomicrobia bacterium]|nr:hypothetical protein [Verrucomicrobiota bacterium]